MMINMIAMQNISTLWSSDAVIHIKYENEIFASKVRLPDGISKVRQ